MMENHRNDNKELLLWCALFLAAASWPVFLFAYPVGQDGFNHLARAFILLNPDDPLLTRHFAVEWKAVPNLGWDVFAVFVGQFMPLNWALKLFMVLGLVLTIAGVFALQHSYLKRWTWVPLMATPFAFHTGYIKAFLSFNVAVGVGLFAAAWWVSQSETRWLRRLLVASAFSVLLFFLHLVAWGIYGIFLLGLKLTELFLAWRAEGSRVIGPWVLTTLRDGLQAVPPFLIVFVASNRGASQIELVGEISEFQTPLRRLVEAWHIMDVGSSVPSLFFLAFVALYLFYLLLWKRTARFSPRFALPIALLVITFFAMPNQIFSTHYIVWRVVLGAVLIAVASGIPKFPVSAFSSRVALSLFVIVTLGLSGWQAYSFSNAEQDRQDFGALIQRIPQGDTLLALHGNTGPRALEFERIGTFHIGSYAVLARKIMVQSQFSNPAQQPISYREATFDNVTVNGRVHFGDLAQNLELQGLSVREHFEHFNWVMIRGINPEADMEEMPLQNFALVSQSGAFRLYCHISKTDKSAPVCPDGKAP